MNIIQEYCLTGLKPFIVCATLVTMPSLVVSKSLTAQELDFLCSGLSSLAGTIDGEVALDNRGISIQKSDGKFFVIEGSDKRFQLEDFSFNGIVECIIRLREIDILAPADFETSRGGVLITGGGEVDFSTNDK